MPDQGPFSELSICPALAEWRLTAEHWQLSTQTQPFPGAALNVRFRHKPPLSGRDCSTAPRITSNGWKSDMSSARANREIGCAASFALLGAPSPRSSAQRPAAGRRPPPRRSRKACKHRYRGVEAPSCRRRRYAAIAEGGVLRKLIAMRLNAFIRLIATVRSTSSFSSRTARAASKAT